LATSNHESTSDTPDNHLNSTLETEKRLRSLFGSWLAKKELEQAFPDGLIILMDSSAPFDLLVIDGGSGRIVAVEVKATTPASKASRGLTPSQRKLKQILESKEKWEVKHEKYVLDGDPGSKASVRLVPGVLTSSV